jgi:hypothetical protein
LQKQWLNNGQNNINNMKKMNAINIDKWRSLNVELFDSYIETYYKLSQNSLLDPAQTLIDVFDKNKIKGELTKDGYGSAYTIAREIGIYFEDSNNYYLSSIAEKYTKKEISYADYLKFYCLNIEFNINNFVVHPFDEIIDAIKATSLTKEEIAQKCTKLIPSGSSPSALDCLRLFLNRCVESKLFQLNSGKYSLAFNYNLLKGSLNKSNYDVNTFNSLFIEGDSKLAQKNIVQLLIQREIPQLFLNPIISSKIISKKNPSLSKTSIPFSHKTFSENCKTAGLIFTNQLIQRFVASLFTKPFVICSGLSGSGKTKLAQAFAQWISADKLQYEIVPVGADWTNREPLLGYPNALNKEEYICPENGVLDLLIRAKNEYDIYLDDETKIPKPYFLILDEMNLSHVERYFADFLSTMESGDSIPLHKITPELGKDPIYVPKSIKLPKNLFIIGTVNIDETTYMFSPKVLDRANTIEFRLTEIDLEIFIDSDIELDMELLSNQGANMSTSFMEMALQKTDKNLKPTESDLKLFFSELKKSGAEFGYRTASEIGRLMKMLELLGEKDDNLLDIAIMQKLLPKLHGSRSKLNTTLTVLAKFCIVNAVQDFDGKDEEFRKTYFVSFDKLPQDLLDKIKYKISFEKISRMHKNALENGFTSYAEA